MPSQGEQLSDSVFSVESAARFPSILGVCVHIQPGADGHNGHGNGTESTKSRRLVSYVNVNVKALTDLKMYISQSMQCHSSGYK